MITRRRSKLHGWGVFATRNINKNKRIVDYAGEKISHQESLKRETRYMKRGAIWCFQINRRWVRDANVGGNIARFINHVRRTATRRLSATRSGYGRRETFAEARS